MTTLAPAPTAPVIVRGNPPGRASLGRLILGELFKIWTTNTWWIFGICMLASTALALLVNGFNLNSTVHDAQLQADYAPPQSFDSDGNPIATDPATAAAWAETTQADVYKLLVTGTANIFTSGQVLGLMFIVMLGVLIVTNEFHHQTATQTFLTTPTRTRVIAGKLIAALLIALGYWLVLTIIDVGVGTLNIHTLGYAVPWGEFAVWRAVLMNLFVFVVWALIGVGLGVLIRNQLGGTITAAVFYWSSWPLLVLFAILDSALQRGWLDYVAIALPGIASLAVVSTDPILGENLPWWVAAIVLVAWGVVATVVGTLITRKRDIS